MCPASQLTITLTHKDAAVMGEVGGYLRFANDGTTTCQIGGWPAVTAVAAEPWMAPGRWGWDGGTGTTAHVDPTRGIVGVLLTQRMMTGPLDGFGEFWTAMAAAA